MSIAKKRQRLFGCFFGTQPARKENKREEKGKESEGKVKRKKGKERKEDRIFV